MGRGHGVFKNIEVDTSVIGQGSESGGFAGKIRDSVIEDVQVTGSVTGYATVGGFTGFADKD